MTSRIKEVSRVLFFLVVGLLVSTSFLGLACRAVMKLYFGPKQNERYASFDATVKERFVKDLKRLKETPPFPTSPYASNALPVLEKHIPYLGTNQELGDSQQVRELFEECKKKTEPPLFQQVMEHPHFSKINTDWMNELEKYDHWSIFSKPSVERALVKAGTSSFLEKINLQAQLPSPDYGLFLNYSYLHFLKTKNQSLAKAYETYWHHLLLLHTSGSLVSSAVASSGMKRGYDLQQAFPDETSQKFQLKLAESYKRVAFGWLGLINNVWDHEMDPTLIEYFKPELGICAAASEPFGNFIYSDLLAESYWPFEPNFELEKERSKSIRMTLLKVCHFPQLAAMIDPQWVDEAILNSENHNEDETLAISELEISKSKQRALAIPYLRRIYWGILSTLSSPNYFRVYEDERYLKTEKD